MATTIKCPVCETPFTVETTDAMPFCSRRCRQIDLGRWLGERYVVPARRATDEGDDDGDESAEGWPGEATWRDEADEDA